MLKKALALAIGLTMIGTLLAGCEKKPGAQGETKTDSSSEIKIGAIFPLTGEISSYGQSSKNALDLLVEQTNKKGGVLGKNIKIYYEDDQNKPDSSLSALNKLTSSTKVSAILGALGSGCSLAIAPAANQKKIPMLTPTSTNVDVTKSGEYVFRTCFTDPFQGTVVSKFANEDLKAKTAAVLYNVGSDYSKGLAEVFKENFTKTGGKVDQYLTYNDGDKDFNAQLTKIKAAAPDVVFLPDYYNSVGLVMKQAKGIGITATFLGVDGWDSPKLFEIAGDAVNGSYFSNHYSPEDTAPEVVQFTKDYQAKYNAVPDALAALTYDGGKILFDAIQKAGSTDADKIKEALKATNGTYVSGKVTLDKDRNPVKSAVMIKMENGKQKFGKKVNP